MSNLTIAEKNDLFRKSLVNFTVILTNSVYHSPHKNEILEAVRQFSDFSSSNDPYNEHDYGAFNVRGKSYFWKIDYYDAEFKYYKEDGNRILTIGEANDY